MNFFAQLTNGVHFDQTKRKQAKKVLKQEGQRHVEQKEQKEDDSALDFFAPLQINTIEKPVKVTKRKREEVQVDIKPVTVFSNEEAVHLFRKQNEIKVYGTDVAHPIGTFSDLGAAPFKFHPNLLGQLQREGYLVPTPIQMQTIPIFFEVAFSFLSHAQ